jgi:hypothetical protein
VKNAFLIIITLLYTGHSFAQDTIEKKNWISNSVIERFFVLKSDEKTKQGPYKAFYKRRTLVALGNYRGDKKTGVWQFFSPEGRLIERFNYDTNSFTFEAPVDTADDVVYMVDDTIRKNDIVTRPLKVGGVYYGFIPFINIFQVPFDTMGVDTDSFDAYIELLVSPLGKLADYKVHLVSPLYKYRQVFNLDTHLFSEPDRTFAPATLNGTPVLSRIIIKCFVTETGAIDFY